MLDLVVDVVVDVDDDDRIEHDHHHPEYGRDRSGDECY
jgi:hypothetical protein